MRLCVVISVFLVFFALFVLGLFLLIPFPLVVFPAIAKTQVWLREKSNGDIPKSTYYWENLPVVEWYDFYFFNVTNPDEVLYEGKTAALVEIGPYSYAETEFKNPRFFYDNGNRVYFRNNKTWVYTQRTSCDRCNYQDMMVLPNAAYQVLVAVSQTTGNNKYLNIFFDLLALFLGESPIRSVPMAGVLFEGYDDPLLDLFNSPMVQLIIKVVPAFKNINLPQLPGMGYFVNYNHTSDGDYDIFTGKDDINNVGLIQKWCNSSQLPWWNDDYSRDITNSSDGSLQQPSLQKSAHIKEFQSFTCRSFFIHYEEDVTVRGIPAYRFKLDADTYDTTTDLNKGYRYNNTERVDYWPGWPCGLNHTYTPNSTDCLESNLDCSSSKNWCTPCCNGTWTNETVYMPPGMFPLMCFPGQPMELPFGAFLTPPHFLWSPAVVQNQMIGINPDPSKHDPGAFDIQPIVGSSVGGYFRMQVVVPIFNCFFTETKNLMNLFTPAVWTDLHVDMNNDAHSFMYLSLVTIPKIVLGFGISFVAGSCIGTVILLVVARRQHLAKRNRHNESKQEAIAATEITETKPPAEVKENGHTTAAVKAEPEKVRSSKPRSKKQQAAVDDQEQWW